ncbi:hypothetical protein JKP88DRAFT_228660, partial [Tribonema minus]
MLHCTRRTATADKITGAAQAWPPPLTPTPPVTVRFLLSQRPVHFGFLLASPLRQCKNRHPRLHGFLSGQWPWLARTHLDHSRHRHEVLGCGHTLGGRCRCSFRLPRPAICIWPRAFPCAARSTCAAAHSCAPAALAASAGTGKASAAAHSLSTASVYGATAAVADNVSRSLPTG